MTACSRFFAVAELVALFLEQAEPPAMVNCLRVCRQWQEIIQNSEITQEHMFLKPTSMTANISSDVSLNPIMTTHFGPLLAPHETIWLSNDQAALRAPEHTYSDLETLPWARDGTSASARSRLAFARKEASWRNMFISQPPMHWIDCWHNWETADRRTDDGRFSHRPVRHGLGHFHANKDIITLGALYDYLEARLVRGCKAQVTFYPQGGSAEQDHMANVWEKRWQAREAPAKGFSTTLPRINIYIHQVWPGEGPAMYQEYRVSERRWEIQDELPFVPDTDRERRRYEANDGDGVAWLQIDCQQDIKNSNWRWSRADEPEEWSLQKIRARASGAESSRSRRFRERHNMPVYTN